MELTLDQALQKGIEAHKAGKVQEADRYYTAILKANPKHPDANHNMGVLAVGVGKLEEALPFFKTALEANPNTAQYWLSYIDALIKLDRIADAKAVFNQAKSKGAKGDGFDKIQLQLNTSTIENKNWTKEDAVNQSNILDKLKLNQALKLAKNKVKDGLSDQAKQIYQDILKKFPKNKTATLELKKLLKKTALRPEEVQDPPQSQQKVLINLYNEGRFDEALDLCKSLSQQNRCSPFLLNLQGALLKGMDRLDLSIKSYREAINIKPDYPEAITNLGNVFLEQGRHEEALEAFTQAIRIKPDYAEAYYNIEFFLTRRQV